MASGRNELLSAEVRKNCEPCDTACKKTEATRYCKECDEYLCDKCVHTHQTIKATRKHLPIPIQAKEKEDSVGCEPCELAGKTTGAANFCETCQEYLCNECTATHKTMKATRTHLPIPIQAKEDSVCCEPCELAGKTTGAAYFCETCQEYLCNECTATHKTMKATKKHMPIAKTQIAHSCDPCSIDEKTSIALKYCELCDEYLCYNCTLVHTRLKATKTHVPVPVVSIKNFGENWEPDEKIHQKNITSETPKITDPKDEIKPQTMCGLCKISNNHDILADLYCNVCCKFLCEVCCKKHKSTKAFKNHTLLSDERQTSVDNTPWLLCDPCKQQDDNKMASGFCQDCENELLCQECIEQHKALKQTRNHDLCLDLTIYENFDNGSDEVTQQLEDGPTIIKENENQKQSKKNTTPGQPRASHVGADSLTLSWDKPSAFKDDDFYQVSYKDVENDGKWKIHPGEFYTATAYLTDLKSNTKFEFRVRAMCNNEEGPYSETSQEVYTTSSQALRLVNFSKIAEEGKPSPTLYILPITEIQNARNSKSKTRKFDAGPAPIGNCKEKTIMLVGSTGSGKSTLVDGIANFALGVNWDDPFRFTIVSLEDEEKQNQHSQAVSPTEWITCYSFNPEKGSRLPYRLNIINTPGFDDTRELDKNQTLVEQIRQFLTEKPPIGFSCIDAVGFLIKAPDARLTAAQSYIFQSVMSLFGKDIETNICSLITFADGKDPPVMAALLKSGLPFGKHFTFNNSALFAKNVKSSSLSPLFWTMGLTSFRDFFDHLEKNMETKSLQLTKDVLDERFRLETTVRNLQPQLDLFLLKANEMKQEIKIIEQNKSLIKDNKDFEYEVTETSLKRKKLAPGLHVTNCTHCNFTCHENCGIPNDGDKSPCIAMKNEICTGCPHKCKWQTHANTPYVWEYVPIKVKKSYAEMEKKYQEASGKLLTQEQVVEKMGEELAELCDDMEELMFIVKECNERLSDIALRQNPLTMTEHIDLMIESEKLEKKDGFMERIATLNEFRQRAQILSSVEDFNKVAQSTLGAVRKKKSRRRDARSIWQNMGSWFGRT